MPFNPAIPQPTDLLSNSQGALLANNGFLNTSFGTDHYAFDDATSNNGKHKVIQMPVQATIPVTTTDPVAFSFQQASGSQGVLQYLGGPSAAVASPILPIQSSAAGISVTSGFPITIFDFTNSLYCYGTVIAQGARGIGPAIIFSCFAYSGSQGIVQNLTPTGFGTFGFSEDLLIFTSTISYTEFSWTLVFNRIFTPL